MAKKITTSLGEKTLLPFTKMHGLGNDFIILDTPPFALSPTLVRALSDRRHGIGCDQLLVLRPSSEADTLLDIWNTDGTKAEACGNGTRCIIGFLTHKHALPESTPFILETPSGLLKGWTTGNREAAVEQGTPSFLSPDPLDLSAWNLPLGFAVSIGNPHLVIFVDNVQAVPLETMGPLLERHPFFPQKTNVEFVEIQGDTLRVRVWERGAGQTKACGSGACAAAFLALRQKRLIGNTVTVRLDGGDLWIQERLEKPILQRGPFQTVFQGAFFLPCDAPVS